MLAQCSLFSATISGVNACLVRVEVTIGSGLPGFIIVGMPDAAIQEARERIKSALKSSGFDVPQKKIVVNLAPGSLRKSGSGFDLPIALCILQATGQIQLDNLEEALFVGELSLDGSIRPIPGSLAYEICAKEHKSAIVLAHDSDDLLPLSDLSIKKVSHLNDFREGLLAEACFEPSCAKQIKKDFAEISGLSHVKRACQIAAAGSLGLLMVGPPGAGKTMLSSRMPSILPPMPEDDLYEVAQIHSVAGLDISGIRNFERPFRSPHHSSTLVSLVGGGRPIKPGEISLAHKGILFLDELAEFPSHVLQSLRQPLESKEIVINRTHEQVCMPADFMLVAATNPCPCGYWGDGECACSCSAARIERYQSKIGGPLLDRIDLHINLKRSKSKDLFSHEKTQSSAQLQEGIMLAHEFRKMREERSLSASKQLSIRDYLEFFGINNDAQQLLKSCVDSLFLSGRSIMSTLRIARIIADIAQKEEVDAQMIAEALSFRQTSLGSGHTRIGHTSLRRDFL